MLGLLASILVAFCYAMDNVLDKYFTAHKIKDEYGYLALSGLVELFVGVVIALFLSWSAITAQETYPSLLAAFFFGAMGYLWISLIKKYDTSNLIGFLYLFPLLLVPLGYIFLGERLSQLGLISVFIIVLGAIVLSARIRRTTNYFGLLYLLPLIAVAAPSDFFIKVSTNTIPPLHGTAITMATTGLLYMASIAVNKKARRTFIKNLHQTKVLLFGELFSIIGLPLLFYANSKLPVIIVSAITCIQPLFVLFIEHAFHRSFGKMLHDKQLMWKLIGIILIVVGLVILTLKEII